MTTPTTPAAVLAATALRNLINAYIQLTESGREKIIEAGGECDPTALLVKRDPALKDAWAAIDRLREMAEGAQGEAVAFATECKAHRSAGLAPGQPLYASPVAAKQADDA